MIQRPRSSPFCVSAVFNVRFILGDVPVLTFWKGKLRDSGKRNKQKVSGEESAESGEIPEYLPICLELRVFWNFCTPRGYSGLQDRGPTTQG